MSSASTTERVAPGAVAAADQVALFHRVLADLCRSEVPLPRALEAVADDIGKGPFADAVRAMAADVAAGAPLAEAYEARASAMPPLYRGLVQAGIASGDLPGILDEIAAHAAMQAEIASRVRRALAYPATAATFVVVTTVFLGVTVGPRLTASYDHATLMEGTLLEASNTWERVVTSPWFGAVIAAGLAIVGAAFVLAFTALRRPFDGATAFSARAWRWPVLGRIRTYAQASTMTATLALLLRRRLPLAHALQLTAETCDEPVLRARVAAMADSADGGATLGETLGAAHVIDPSLVWIVDSAERRGQAAEALADVASVYRERLSRAVDRAVLRITPLAEIVVGLVVACVALAVIGRLAAITSVLDALGMRQ